MNGGRGIEKGCLLVFFVKGARTAIVNVLTVLESQNLEPNKTILFSPIWCQFQSEDGIFLCRSYAFTYLPDQYVSTIVLLVLVPTYVHADMLATHENNMTLTGQKWNKKGRCRRMSGRHFLTCLRHVVRHVNVTSKLPMPTSDKPN
jgi:hypothetical protein